MQKTAVTGAIEPRRFAALDGWRGISALMIVLLHAPVAGAVGGSSFVRHAFLFVDLFFVLSGFVIAHAFADRIVSSGDVGRFLRGRIRRVYPLHLAMLALFVLFEGLLLVFGGPGSASTGGNNAGSLLANLTMTHALGTVSQLGWNYPSWSISAELVAYLLFALLMAASRRALLLVFTAVALAAPVFLFQAVGHIDTTVEWGWLRCLYGFALGTLLRLVIWPRIGRNPPSASALWTGAEIATLLAVAVFVTVAGTTALSLAAPLVFAYAIAVFAHEGGAVSRILKAPAVQFLGLVSYSIYMTHAFVIARGINAASAVEAVTGWTLMRDLPDGTSVVAGGEGRALVALGLIFCATLVFSALTYRFIERPALRIGRQETALPGSHPLPAA